MQLLHCCIKPNVTLARRHFVGIDVASREAVHCAATVVSHYAFCPAQGRTLPAYCLQSHCPRARVHAYLFFSMRSCGL